MARFSEKNQPKNKRGKEFRTLMLDAIREQALIGLPKNASKERTEKAFLAHVAGRAFDPSDQASHILLKEFISKSYASIKPTMERVEFDLPEGSTVVEKVNAILLAVSKGEIPPDSAQMVISMAKDASVIEANEDLKSRIEAIEESLGLKLV